MSGYTGLCIGGPSARKVASCQARQLRVAIPSEVGPSPSDASLDLSEPIAAASAGYSFTEFWRADPFGNTESRGFWVTEDVKGDPIFHVVDTLAREYASDCDKIAAERERCARIVEESVGMSNARIAQIIRTADDY